MALGKGAITKHAGQFKAREVHVPAWADESGDDVVLVRGMTLREFEINQSRADEGEATASVLARCIVAPDGGRVFEDDDVQTLADLPLGETLAIQRAINEESGLTDKNPATKIATAVADAEGNSETTPTSDSSTG